MLRKLWVVLLASLAFGGVAQAQQVIQDSIVGNMTLTNDRTWLLRGYVYVVNGATLTIEPGTIIFGEKVSKGTLIVERGGKLIADGKPERPIVFTSQLPPGQRSPGDWGGIAICGRAPMNRGEVQLEGGPRSMYGGNVPDDNSGIIRYVRIEYPGIALSPNNEINALTLGAVGTGTQIDHVQVSYSGDDGFEWYGGGVNAKYLVALASVDDSWDADFGYHGKVQFGVSLVSPNFSDVSGTNGIESDNNGVPNTDEPRTSATFSNFTIIGPLRDTSDVVNPLFRVGAHLRRNTLLSVFNSVIMGWPTGGFLMDGSGVTGAATSEELSVRNTIIAGVRQPHARTNVSGFDVNGWYHTGSFGNTYVGNVQALEFTDPFNLTAPNFNPAPTSAVKTGASFTHTRVADPFFTPTMYRGAFGGATDWTLGWANFNPQQTSYTPVAQLLVSDIRFPNTLVGASRDSQVVVIRNSGNGPLNVTNFTIGDTSRFKLVGGASSFALVGGESRTITVRFSPNDTSTANSTITFTANGENHSITLSGKGLRNDPVVKLETGSKLNFALVRINESVEDRVIVSNIGTAPLNINNITISGADASAFTIVSGGSDVTLAPKAKHSVVVRFSPTATRDYSANLTFAHNGANSPASVELMGTGIQVYGQDVLQGEISTNVTLTNDRIWLLRGFVYVVDGGVLNIEPGTVIFGEKSTKGTLVIERGGRINAQGTPELPIVFTSQMPVGQRAPGDWGGIAICGRAPINLDAGEAQVEGGPRSRYGGSNPADNSGVFSYVRIEFNGIALSPNNELNGLTLGAVGSATKVDHIQVSFSGDDSYEWYGGTVSSKHLIAHRGVDDDFDSDFGFSGNVQFAVSQRDPALYDISGSNGFETDNNNVPNTAEPRTSAKFSNVTVVGPKAPGVTNVHPLFQHGAHIRRNSLLSIYNSVIMGYPTGIILDQTGVTTGAASGQLQVRNTTIAYANTGKDITTNVSSFNALDWFNTPSFGNNILATIASLNLDGAFNLTNPEFRPSTGSSLLSGASFSGLNGFETVNYRGAFGGTRWDSLWSNYSPQTTVYAPIAEYSSTAVNFGKVGVGQTGTKSFVVSNTGGAPLRVTSITFQGTEFTAASMNGFTVVQRGSNTMELRFNPSVLGMASGKLILHFSDETQREIDLTGEGVVASVKQTRTASGVELFQNAPNPFSHSTNISFTLPSTGDVKLVVVDVTGRVVASLLNETVSQGSHSVQFNAENLPQGTYFYHLNVDGAAVARSMVVVK